MKKKLTDFQIENIIENVIETNESSRKEKFKKHYIKKLRECKTKKETFSVLNELFSMQSKFINEGYGKNYITEAMLKDIFSLGLSGGWQILKEYIYTKILNKIVEVLNIKANPELIRAISVGLSNIDLTTNWRKFLSPIKNCEFFAEAIVTGIVEIYADKKIRSMFPDSVFGSTIRNTLVEFLRTQKDSKDFQSGIYSKLCEAIRKAFSGTNLTDVVKQKLGGAMSSSIPKLSN